MSNAETSFRYDFKNFFHPFVGELVKKLNRDSVPGLLDAEFHKGLEDQRSSALPGSHYTPDPEESQLVEVKFHRKNIDVDEGGPYSNYNWELLFHVPLTIAVHLSKNQRFAEAQRWFHYIFDPTSNDTSEPAPNRYWKFLRFRQPMGVTRIDELVAILSKPASKLNDKERGVQEEVIKKLNAIKNHPFQPHVVARARPVAYQYSVVMKYLDNLIAWGDSLFMQDTIESINEATQLYVLAANILGERPQRIPPTGTVHAKSYKKLKEEGIGPIGNAFVNLEHQFPFNGSLPRLEGSESSESKALFGIGRTLYFCVPRNEKLLGYWDTVADRLFKIRHCMNIEGVVRQLALFDPPIDPGMLVKAAAAGIDIGSIVAGLNQPIGPVRSLFLVQKSLELAGEVRGLGSALLSAIEKGDGERLALLRQSHEIKIQQMAREVRFLQWKQAQESSESLLRGRGGVLERFRYYQRLHGLTPDTNAAPDTFPLDRRDLTEENFDEAYTELVGQYEKALVTQAYPQLRLAGDNSPRNQSGATGKSQLYLSYEENTDLNELSPAARDHTMAASGFNALAAGFAPVPDADVDFHFWGIGGKVKLNVGTALVAGAKITGEVLGILAGLERENAGMASKTASYLRRADDWTQQSNLAAHELMQIGRQIIGSLIAEQIAYREYQNVQQQIEQSKEVDRFLHEKFSNEELYAWMQGELTRLSYEYYRFAFDTARKAERAMKHELMRPEVDATEYVKFNYWDGGRKGLLSGEALYLDLKRMEMAYHENNKREYELTKHVSLRQLNPVALLTLKATGSCEVNVPEWLFDMDVPGHYMRRIKNVSLSIPAVTGPYTSVNCTLSLLKSTLRRSPLLKDGEYQRAVGEDDTRFVDYYGTIQSIVTSNAQNDSGMFDTNLRDERFLPFEGAGVHSTWKLELPAEFRQFDYNTISDVILHIRYTARQGGKLLGQKAVEHLRTQVEEASTSGLVQLFSLKHDFPSEWHRFVAATNEPLELTVTRDFFLYITQGHAIRINAVELHSIIQGRLNSMTPSDIDLDAITDSLTDDNRFDLLLRSAEVDKEALGFVLIRYSLDSNST